MSEGSLSSQIKNEIIKFMHYTKEEWAAEMAAISLCSGWTEKEDTVSVTCAKEPVAQRLLLDSRKAEGIQALGEVEKVGRRGGSVYTVSFPGQAWAEFIEPYISPDVISDEISEDGGLRRAMLRGAFLARGSFSDPKNKTRIEILCRTDAFVKPLILLFHMEDIQPMTRVLDQVWSLYFKKIDEVSDFLVILGAMNQMMDLQTIRVQRNVNKMVASSYNLDNWTMKRQAEASAARTRKLEELLASEKAGRIPKDLLEVARLHIDNPGLSLTELGRLMDPPISKSGMNHRLNKLIDML